MTEQNMSLEELAELAAQTEDQSEVTSGGDFEYETPEAGKTMARLIEYIELGKHDGGEYQGKKKPDEDKVRIVFELLSPKHIKEVEVDGGKKQIANRITLKLGKKLGEKAAFKKFYNKIALAYPDVKHLATAAAKKLPFVLTVIHNDNGKEGAEKRTYANIRDKDGTWYIEPAVVEDVLSGTRTILPVPEALSPAKLFLFDNPTKVTWDSLFIDGTRTVKDDKGNEKEQSKNWLQETILSAKNYKGSKLEAFLAGVGNLPISEEKKPEQSSGVSDGLPEEKKAETKPTAANAANAALAELGLV